MGNAHLSLFPYEPLPTGDGELIVIAGNDGQFRMLAAALGIAEVADDERFATVGARNDNREQLRPILLERLATRSAQEWFEVLTGGRHPVRADQRRARRRRAGRLARPRAGRARRRHPDRPQPDPAVGDAGALRPAAAGARRARRRDPRWLGVGRGHPHDDQRADPPVPSA